MVRPEGDAAVGQAAEQPGPHSTTTQNTTQNARDSMLDPTGGARARSEPVPAHSTPRLTTEEARLAEQDAHHRRERQQFEEKIRSMEADMTRQHKAMTLQQERHDEETETLRSLLDDFMAAAGARSLIDGCAQRSGLERAW